MTDSDPLTAFDEVTDRLAETGNDGSMSTSPAEMLANDDAVTFPLRLYGQEFTVLAFTLRYDNHVRNRDRLTTVVYPPDADLDAGDSVRTMDYIEVKHMRQRDLSSSEEFDDISHMLATAVGYHTRYLLDGRDYRYGSSRHDEAKVKSL